MRIPLTHYPGMNPFVLDWVRGDERFLPRSAAAKLPHSGPKGGGFATALLESNRKWGIFIPREEMNRWARGETRTLVAGQQVGFAGGPLYTLAKIATLLKMKRASKEPATAFFWLATEDHDFDEVAQLNVPVAGTVTNRQLDLMCIRAVRSAEMRSVVGPLAVPEALVTELLALFDMQRPTWLREGITFRDSFAELIASVTGNEVILVDALLPELRRAGAPLFDQIRQRENEIQHVLADRAKALESAGYKEQVVPADGERYTLLYEIDEQGRRQKLTNGAPPERISTSALTRPLLQDFVLQPDVFVGGPAEVAYYAQLAPLHELLNVRMPKIALRGHALVAPKRVARAFERFGIDPCYVFRSADEMLAEREPENVARVKEIAEEAKRDLMIRIEQISELALPADHSLAGSFQRSIGHLEWHFNKLTERAIKGIARKDKERLTAVRELVSTLFPDRHVQDRIVSWYAYWREHGEHLMERIVEEIEPDSDHFRIVTL